MSILATTIDYKYTFKKRKEHSDMHMALMRLMVLVLTYPIGNALLQGGTRAVVLGALVLTQEIPYPYV